jgi:hypothetical protein
MNKLITLTTSQLRIWLRTRSYTSSVAAALCLVGASGLLNETGGTESYRLLTDFGLLFTGTICAVVGMAFTLSSLTAPDELLLLQQIAVRPIDRSTILLSRLFAGVGAVVLSLTIVTAALLLVGVVVGVPHPARIVVGAAFGAQEALLAVALSVAAAANSSRVVASAVAVSTYFLCRVGVPAADFHSGASLLRYLPRFDRFSLAQWVHGGALPDDMAFRLAYTAALFVMLTGIGVWRFTDRDLGAR